MTPVQLSFVIPARNEEALIAEVLQAILASVADTLGIPADSIWLPASRFEVIVADDGSEDATRAIVQDFADRFGVRLVSCHGRSCAAARNAGAAASAGPIICFVDADTIIPVEAADRILSHHGAGKRCLVLYQLASREPGLRAWLWWTLWGLARSIPMARAKSMPAFMSVTKHHYARYGPFRESWLIAEEWPLTCAAWNHHRQGFLYDRTVVARTSSRRMELQRFGYTRTYIKWISVVLFPWSRTSLNHRIRHALPRDTATNA